MKAGELFCMRKWHSRRSIHYCCRRKEHEGRHCCSCKVTPKKGQRTQIDRLRKGSIPVLLVGQQMAVRR